MQRTRTSVPQYALLLLLQRNEHTSATARLRN
jgi:hypothetical protein